MLLALASFAFGADWQIIANTEEGREDRPIQLFGFVQPQVEGIVRGQLVNDQRPVFNLVNGKSPWAFVVRRARLGARGSIPGTNQKVTYYLLAEAGEVSITRGSPVVVTDMHTTISYIPGARIRIGQGKLPIMEEVVQAVAASLEFVSFSKTLVALTLENPITAGQYSGGAYGFRDVGIQVFDGFQQGHFAASYAVMVSNGAGIHDVDLDGPKDVTARAEVGWVPGDATITQGRRQEVKIGGWWLEGSRELEGERHRRVRRGAYVHAEHGKAWALVEVAQGEGMLEAGRAPPFPGGELVVSPDGKGWGVVASAGVRVPLDELSKKLSIGFKGRYDQYHQRYDDREALRVFRTGTLGVEVNPVPRVRLQANYELRMLAAPEGSDAAREIAASMGDRISVQVTARF